MGESCCQKKSEDLKFLVKKQKKVLWIVLLINALMFFIEYIWGYLAGSQALMADSLDMLGDALAYGSTLFVISSSMSAKAKSAFFKALIMLATGLSVFAKTIYHFFILEVPRDQIMLTVAVLALAMNGLCLFLLTKHRNDDINFKSVWICSRNDIVANSSVIVAALLVAWLSSPYPDLIVGLGIAVLFLKSAISVMKQSRLAHSNARSNL